MSNRRLLPALALLVALVALVALAAALPAQPATAAPAANSTFGATWRSRLVIRPRTGEYNFVDPIHGRLFMVGDTRVAVWSTTSGAPLGNIPFNPMVGFRADTFDTGFVHLYAVTDRDYAADEIDIGVFNTVTLAETNRFTFTCPAELDVCEIRDMVVGPDGRVYIALYTQSRLYIVDSATGQTIDTLDDPGLPTTDLMASLAVDGDRLYVANYVDESENSTGLAVFDISAVAPARVAFHALANGHLSLSPDGQYLSLLGQTVRQYRAQPFGLLWEIDQPPLSRTYGHFPNGDLLLIDQTDSHRSVVTALDALTGAPRRSMTHVHQPGRESFDYALPLAGGELAALYTSYADLRRPTDYAAAVPLTMNNACPGGPVVDRFTDPTSGWPIISDGPITTRYFEDSYRISLRDAGLWTAVTRGDYWYQADLAIALGHTLGSPLEPTGVTGFLYGLNDDWSDFYTVEISLYDHHYYHFHFHDGDWQLLNEGTWHGAVSGPVLIGLDRRRDSGEVVLKVGGDELYVIEEVPGRVGITAGSFIPAVEARYTHYEFHGQNCTENGSRAAALDVVPAAVARLHP